MNCSSRVRVRVRVNPQHSAARLDRLTVKVGFLERNSQPPSHQL